MANRNPHRPFRGAFRSYVATVLVLGAAGWSWALGSLPGRGVWAEPTLLLFGALLLAGQFRSVVYRGRSGRTDYGFTVPFSLAVFVLYGPAVAILVDGGMQALGDVLRRKPAVKVLFNMSVTAVGFHLLAGAFAVAGLSPALPPAPGPAYLLVFTAGGIASLLVGHAAVLLVVALSQGLSPRDGLQPKALLSQASSSALLVPLALLAASAAERSAWLLPVAALPVLVAEVVTIELGRRRFEANHDTDTGLLNRHGLVQRLSRDRPERCTIAYVQLGGLDELAEALSPDRVDQLRRLVAGRLTDLLGDDALVARTGDDALAVVVPGDGLGVAEALARWLAEPFRLESWNLAVEATVGVASTPEHGVDPEQLLKRAKAAAYSATRQKVHTAVYCSGIEDEQQERLSLLAEVRRALHHGELTLHYQPRLCLRTGRPVGVEALVRWEHPERGMVPPDAFVPAIEQTLLIDDLTRWVLDRAARQLADWRAEGLDLKMAVNIAAHNLLDPGFVGAVARVLDRAGLEPGLLECELTERSVASDVERTRGALGDLADLGVRLSLDDFGTGYSSLAQLRTLPVHMVKIDRSFVMPLSARSSERALVAAMVGLASGLGLEIVAEGVETGEASAVLSDLGCGSAQGYFFSRPLPAAGITPWLRERGGLEAPVARLG